MTDALNGLYEERLPGNAFRIARERITEVCAALRDAGYEHLSLITAIDWRDRWELVYHVVKYGSPLVVLRTVLPYDDPSVESVASVWPAAVWHERETFDLMGVVFRDNPDLRRILMPEDYDEHPLRKEVLFGNRS